MSSVLLLYWIWSFLYEALDISQREAATLITSDNRPNLMCFVSWMTPIRFLRVFNCNSANTWALQVWCSNRHMPVHGASLRVWSMHAALILMCVKWMTWPTLRFHSYTGAATLGFSCLPPLLVFMIGFCLFFCLFDQNLILLLQCCLFIFNLHK